MRWNKRELAQLEKLWAAGQSAAQIARHLECSRNAVCGRLARLGLTRGHKPPTAKPKIDPPRSEGRRRWRLVAIASERSCRKRR
ncbi:GcrA family cell cycle regulator [Bradyrhizobium sp. 137]|uniref:GcrA family cell cycle regulator n=1 Tax=Bradyrhizobium sp. 137 TaxID=2782614 RepID=UPI001FF8103E|nr:GcrA family cell cycle regulator [Bradyrhizobium sp. 137]